MSILEIAGRIAAARQAIAALQPRIAESGPWPLSDSFGTEPEASWGPPETLAHVAEIVPYWMGEIERVIDGPEPAPFGRVPSNEVRIALIGRDRTVPLRELHARIDSSLDRVARRLAELGPDELSRRGLHPTLGEMTVDTMARRLLANHLEEHVVQLEGILAARDAGEG
jgi:hypothetical protein